MKNKIVSALATLALVAGITIESFAQAPPINPSGLSAFTYSSASGSYQWSYTGGTGLTNFVVIPALGTKGAQTPALTYLQAVSDKGGSVVTAWYAQANENACVGTNFGLTNAYVATTNCYVNTTNGLAYNMPMVVVHQPSQTYEIRMLSNITTFSTNISTNVAFPYAITTNFTYQLNVAGVPNGFSNVCSPSDLVFGYAPQGTLAIGVGTVSFGPAPYVIAGQWQTPLLLSINAGTNSGINAATGSFLP